jgi:hypothetical protein
VCRAAQVTCDTTGTAVEDATIWLTALQAWLFEKLQNKDMPHLFGQLRNFISASNLLPLLLQQQFLQAGGPAA